MYTWFVQNNIWLYATTGRTTTVDIPNRNPIAPIGYSVWTTEFSKNIRSLSGQFTWYFSIEDSKGTSWRYTTITFPLRLSGMNFTDNYIDRTNIRFMATGVDLVGIGLNNTSSVYMVRDYVAWEYSCPTWVYGNKPNIEITLPAWQNPDTYSGDVNIYLYE